MQPISWMSASADPGQCYKETKHVVNICDPSFLTISKEEELFYFLAEQLVFTKPAIDGTHHLSILEKGKDIKRGRKRKIVSVEYMKEKKKKEAG